MTTDLTTIRPVVSSPREFFDKLVQASLDGKLPAWGRSDGDYLVRDLCRYHTTDGRQCGIGLLYSPEDAAALEAGQAGSVNMNSCLFGKILPDWLSLDDAIQVQRAHDGLGALGRWSHDTWVDNLRAIPLFSSF